LYDEAPSHPSTSPSVILGLDNVPLELPHAGVGSRTLAAIIDYALFAIAMGLWMGGGWLTLSFLEISGGWTAAILILGAFLLQWSFFAVLEIAMQGQTPGKYSLNLRVVAYHGGRAGNAAIVVRNLLRTLDLALGLPSIAIDSRSRRLGDLAAGTLVVHERSGDGETVLKSPPASWGAREITVVESFLSRAAEMEGPRAQRLATQLLRWILREEPAFVAAEDMTTAEGMTTEDRDPVAALRHLLEAETS
jgi:uncharacterized RDD family membrane protein YckC